MPRFVLLYHDCPPHFERPSHWDLMLEAGATLRTWGLRRLPSDWRVSQEQTAAMYADCPPIGEENSVRAERLGDHRLDYLDKEGPLSGDRGHVRRVERGTYESEAESPGRWQVTLVGHNWRGRVLLQQIALEAPEWTLTVQ